MLPGTIYLCCPLSWGSQRWLSFCAVIFPWACSDALPPPGRSHPLRRRCGRHIARSNFFVLNRFLLILSQLLLPMKSCCVTFHGGPRERRVPTCGCFFLACFPDETAFVKMHFAPFKKPQPTGWGFFIFAGLLFELFKELDSRKIL